MSLNQRHLDIMDLARQNGFLPVGELTRLFRLTPQTLRRDINELCKRGLLRRYHGGASLNADAESAENDDANRRTRLPEGKRRIARLVAEHIPDKASLFIDLGTTTGEVAKALGHKKNLRVITNNLKAAALLSENEHFEVLIAGGLVRRDHGIIGESAVDFIRQFKVDYGIIGISGIDANGALRDVDCRAVGLAQAIIENARQVFLVADHSKFHRAPMLRFGQLSRIDALFTDQTPPEALVTQLKQTQTRLFVAE